MKEIGNAELMDKNTPTRTDKNEITKITKTRIDNSV